MVQLMIRLTAASGQAPQLVQALHTLMPDIRPDGGCSGSHLAADVDDAGSFWYCEDWPDLNVFEWELRSNRFLQLLALMETSVQPPLLELRMVAETRGLEYVSAVRTCLTQG